jgi:hypothetical protein
MTESIAVLHEIEQQINKNRQQRQIAINSGATIYRDKIIKYIDRELDIAKKEAIKKEMNVSCTGLSFRVDYYWIKKRISDVLTDEDILFVVRDHYQSLGYVIDHHQSWYRYLCIFCNPILFTYMIIKIKPVDIEIKK